MYKKTDLTYKELLSLEQTIHVIPYVSWIGSQTVYHPRVILKTTYLFTYLFINDLRE